MNFNLKLSLILEAFEEPQQSLYDWEQLDGFEQVVKISFKQIAFSSDVGISDEILFPMFIADVSTSTPEGKRLIKETKEVVNGLVNVYKSLLVYVRPGWFYRDDAGKMIVSQKELSQFSRPSIGSPEIMLLVGIVNPKTESYSPCSKIRYITIPDDIDDHPPGPGPGPGPESDEKKWLQRIIREISILKKEGKVEIEKAFLSDPWGSYRIVESTSKDRTKAIMLWSPRYADGFYFLKREITLKSSEEVLYKLDFPNAIALFSGDPLTYLKGIQYLLSVPAKEIWKQLGGGKRGAKIKVAFRKYIEATKQGIFIPRTTEESISIIRDFAEGKNSELITSQIPHELLESVFFGKSLV